MVKMDNMANNQIKAGTRNKLMLENKLGNNVTNVNMVNNQIIAGTRNKLMVGTKLGFPFANNGTNVLCFS